MKFRVATPRVLRAVAWSAAAVLAALAGGLALAPARVVPLLERGAAVTESIPFPLLGYVLLGIVVASVLRLGRGGDPAAGPSWGWARSLALGGTLFGIYDGFGDTYNIGDTIPAALLPVALIRGDGPFLERFLPDPGETSARVYAIYFYRRSRGHLISEYPLGAPLLAVPFVLPQVLAEDWRHPGWDRGPEGGRGVAEVMARRAAGAIAALTGVALLHLLIAMGLRRVAFPTVLAAALASGLWNEGARALWQHGPAALCLTLAIWLLHPGRTSRARTTLAGLATAMLPACRPNDVLLAAAIAAWMTRHRRRDLPWFLPPLVAIGVALVAYNYWFFGSIKGGYVALEGGRGLWESLPRPFAPGAAGTLFSPSRGLFVFTPWVALALAALVATARRLRAHSLVLWLVAALVPYFVVLSKTMTWWAGQSFGPRFWIDAVPLFAILLALALERTRTACRPALWAFALAIGFSLGVQLLGASGYPTMWGIGEFDEKKLWRWRDSELSQCWRDALAPRPERP